MYNIYYYRKVLNFYDRKKSQKFDILIGSEI